MNESIYAGLVARRILLLVGLLITLVLGMLYSVTLGFAEISIADVYGLILQKLTGIGDRQYSMLSTGIILQIRLPRVFLAIIAGISLGTNGAIMQSLLKNPLASPYTLGISSGAACGAAVAIVAGNSLLGSTNMLHWDSWLTIIGAFAMGLLTILLINIIASLKKSGASTLILAGVALSYLFSAGISFFKYIADHEQLQQLTLWLMGGLYRAEWLDVLLLTPIMGMAVLYILRRAWDINALNAGEEVAANLGINVQRLRKQGSIVAAFLTSVVVAFTGIIGFIGLVAPHISRMIVGNDNRFLILASGLTGGIFLLLADTAARIIIDPVELPVGIITALCGAPFFLYMLLKRRREYWS